MAIHTSANTYSRGVKNVYSNYTNFFFVAQANNVIPAPTRKFLDYNTLINRNIVNSLSRRNTYPWSL
jgi:hypothetical protein